MKSISREQLQEVFETMQATANKVPEYSQTPDFKLVDTAWRTHQSVKAATGLSFDHIVLEGGPANAAAFIQTDNRQTFIMAETLKKEHEAVNAAFHEKEHAENQIFDFKLEQVLSQNEIAFLAKKLDVSDLADINLVEGFTHARTLKNTYADNTEVYSKEVRVALILDELSQKHLQVSLLDLYHIQSYETFKSTLKTLCTMLMTRDELSGVLKQAA